MERYDRPVHCSQLSHTLRFVQYKNIVNVRVQAVHISMSFRTNDRRVEKGANHAAQVLPALNIIVHDSRHHADDQEAQECCYVHDGDKLKLLKNKNDNFAEVASNGGG